MHFTDEDGKFRAENLRPGITVVKAEREGYVTFYKRNVVIRADETIDGYTVADDARRRDGRQGVRLDGPAARRRHGGRHQARPR